MAPAPEARPGPNRAPKGTPARRKSSGLGARPGTDPDVHAPQKQRLGSKTGDRPGPTGHPRAPQKQRVGSKTGDRPGPKGHPPRAAKAAAGDSLVCPQGYRRGRIVVRQAIRESRSPGAAALRPVARARPILLLGAAPGVGGPSFLRRGTGRPGTRRKKDGPPT